MNKPKDSTSTPRSQCTVSGCCARLLAKGVCRKHYERLRRHGRLENDARSPKFREIRKHVDHTDDACLFLSMPQSDNGYISIYYEGVHTHAHRVMCKLVYGPPPEDDMHAAHKCGRGREGCLNPKHLYWATRLENAADSIAHGHQLRGEDAPRAVLTEDNVRYIRKYPRYRGYQRELAEYFCVSRPTITAVISRRIWKHVS